VGHVISWNHMEDGYVYDAIKVIQMPLFMMVSGYLCGMGKRVRSLADYGRVLKKRAIAYLVPFFFWIVLQHPLQPVSNIVETLFALDKGLWYLMTVFVLAVMIYTAQLAAAKAGKRQNLVFWSVYLFLALLIVAQSFSGWTFLSPGLTRLYLPFYFVAYLAGAYQEQVAQIPVQVKHFLFWPAAVAFLYLVFACDLLDVSSLVLLGRQMLASFLGCYTVIWLMSFCKEGKAGRFLAWLGNYTLEIYVLHFHFATILNQGREYRLFTWEGLWFAVASFAVMSAITAGIIFVTKKVWVLDFLLYGKTRQKKQKTA